MQRKEINEIKGLFKSIDDCDVTRLAGCYVNGNKEKVSTFNEVFLDLPSEEIYKYLEIFRKSLSGTVGKNLLDMEFKEEGDGKRLLNAVRKTQLKDEETLNLFYDQVINTYETPSNYLILLVAQTYDVPGKTTDGLKMDETSEFYDYILCTICPVKLTEPGLGYDEEKTSFHTIQRFFTVDLPEDGFLYPAFTDRETDDSKILYYSKKADQTQRKMMDQLLQCGILMPAKKQTQSFQGLVSDVLGDEADFETVRSLQNEMTDFVKKKKQELKQDEEINDGAVTIGKEDVKGILERSGVSEERLKSFDHKFEVHFGKKVDLTTGEIIDDDDPKQKKEKEKAAKEAEEDAPFVLDDQGVQEAEVNETASSEEQNGEPHEFQDAYDDKRIFAENLIPSKKFEMKTADVVVRINSDRTDLVETRMVDGKKCLVIQLQEGLVVNGIPVK